MVRTHRSTRHDSRCANRGLTVVTLAILACAGPAPANSVETLTWERDAAGRTVVVIHFAETIDPSSFRSYPLSDPSREVIVVSGIHRKPTPDILTIADGVVERIRLVTPADADVPELLVVLDLAIPTARLVELYAEGRRLTGLVEPVDTTPTPRAEATPAASGAALQTTDRPALPSEPSVQPTPSPTEAHGGPEAVSPGSAARAPDRPPPVLVPTATARLDVGDAPDSRTVAPNRPTPSVDAVEGTRVVDIVVTSRRDTTTLLRVTADGPLRRGVARTLSVPGESSRIVVSLRGLSAPDLPRTIDVGDQNIDRIRLIHDTETADGELHLVVHLARPDVVPVELEQVGPNLVVVFEAMPPTVPAP